MNISEINILINDYSNTFDYNKNETAIILAAGHGKRIKSNTSKMLHKIWQTPTVERVINSCGKSLSSANIIVVVGIKAEEVIKSIGKNNSLLYAYQEIQNGTGHAVQMGLEKIDFTKYDGTVFVFPGDMGLINAETIKSFKDEFYISESDMMVLTGLYEGNEEDNHYGRIVRANSKGKSPNKVAGNVLEILEYKDIMNLDDKEPYKIILGKKEYIYSKKELMANNEFNSGVFAFKFKPLVEQISKIEGNNVQSEIYLTDLIGLFNKSGYKVKAVSPKDQYVVMGFNTKSVLLEMEKIAQKNVYNKIKDIVTIEDSNDFFIDESIVEDILELDKSGVPVDIKIGKGASIGKGVRINYKLEIGKNVKLSGNINFGRNNFIGDCSLLSCFYGQSIQFGDNSEIHRFCTIKGNVVFGNDCNIESNVRITGSDDSPVVVGNKVTIKGSTYIFGSKIDNNILIENSVLVKKNIVKPELSKTEIYKVKNYLPEPEGIEAVNDLK